MKNTVRNFIHETKLPLWKLEQQLAAAQAKFERCETAYRQAERELWTARNAVDCRRAEVQA